MRNSLLDFIIQMSKHFSKNSKIELLHLKKYIKFDTNNPPKPPKNQKIAKYNLITPCTNKKGGVSKLNARNIRSVKNQFPC
jgi:hypothetical protein